MSFIIKALRKVEKEKAAARDAREVDISSAILSPDTKRSRPSRITGIIVTFSLIAFAVVCAALYHFMNNPARKNIHPEQASEKQRSTPPHSFARDERDDIRAVSPAPVEEERKVRRGDKVAESMVKPPALEKPTLPGMHAENMAKVPARRRLNDDADREGLTASVSAPSTITVNGIAFQDDPRASIAVVNGKLLKAGMTIEGVQIEKIFVDRVRFRGNGGTFEVDLTK